MNAIACAIATWTARIFGRAETCAIFFVATLACFAYFALSPSWDRFNSLFTMAGMWALSGLQWSSNRSSKEDKGALAALVKASDAPDDAAPVMAVDDPEPRRS